MEADTMTRIRPVGERFAHPVHGELIVVAQAGCAGCAFDPNTCTDGDRRQITGTCSLNGSVHGVVFARVKDYAVLKVTGEWP